MQATPQQVSGGNKYSSSTRIGNWQEEIAFEDAKKNNFITKSKTGNLTLRKQETKSAKLTEIVPHTYSEDKLIRFGDSVLLQHILSSTVLGCDTFDEIFHGSQKFSVSNIVGEMIPRARNTFRIVRPPSHLANYEDDPSDPILKFGQPFSIACNESLLVSANSRVLEPTLYLCSTKRNERNATKITNRQLVYLSPLNDAESIWVVVKPSQGRKNSSDRFLSVGQPVTSSDDIQFTHRQTNMYLTCDPKESFRTEFGVEFETFADRSASVGKLGIVVSEFSGLSTPQTLTKADAPTFGWHIKLADNPGSSIDNRSLPPEASNATILSEIREYIRFRGIDGYLQLRDYLVQVEIQARSEGRLDREDLKDALLAFGLPVEGKYLDPIIDLVDKKQLGLIDWRELMRSLRGPVAPIREKAIEDAFHRLDFQGKGAVAFDSISKHFHGVDHPLVKECGFSEEEALNHFLGTFKARGGKNLRAATLDAFYEYYADLSVHYINDMEFVNLLKSNWRSLF